MNIDRIREWTTTLRSDRFQQGNGRLVVVDKDRYNYCCLGVGCEIAGVAKEVVHTDADEEYLDLEAETTVYYGEVGNTELAPQEFLEWLGLSMPPGDVELDIDIDIDAEHPGFIDRDGHRTVTWSCAGLNDQGFTFDQIADIIDYFGIRVPG